MKYIALYRKYRPQVFEDVVEQETVVRILQEALKQKKIAHAYLFAGPKGTGKTSIARIFAKGLNCENGPTPHPCMKCEQCLSITNGTNLDVIEIDAASNRGIDEIRDLKEKVKYAPVSARYKVYIIDEAHMLTMQAFNALLKTLEEPPENVVFILATTEPEKIPATILSRCERFYFKRISLKGLFRKIKEVSEKEGFEIEDAAAMLIARFSTGSLRNALSLLDQASTMFDKITEENVRSLLGMPQEEILYELLKSIVDKNTSRALSIIRNTEESGKDSKIFVNEFLSYLQDLINLKILGFDAVKEEIGEGTANLLKEQAKYVSVKKLIDISWKFADVLNSMRFFPDPFFAVELTALQCIDTEKAVKGAAVEETEEKLPEESVQVPKEETFTKEEPSEPRPKISAKAKEIKEENPTERKEEAEKPSSESGETAEGLDLIKNQWANILEEVRKVNKPLHAMLERVHPVELNGEILSLIAEKKFYVAMLKREENIEILQKAIEALTKKKFVIKYVEEEEKREDEKNEEEEIEKLKNDKTIREILTLFDGNIANVKKIDKEGKESEKS